ncbi:MAG: peptidoglycan-binding domain-containing protein [Nitrospirota bacterium]
MEAKARENNALQQRLATLLKTPARDLSSEPKAQARVVITARPTPTGHDLSRPSSVRKGSYDSLELTRPHRRGTHVKQVRRLLRRHGLPVQAGGIYGGTTEAAVRSFHGSAGFQPTAS